MSTQDHTPRHPHTQVRARSRPMLGPANQSSPAAQSNPPTDGASVVVRRRFRPVLAHREVDVPTTAVLESTSEAPLPPKATPKDRQARTGPNWDENGNYLIGKGRPPRNHRIQPGEVRNKRGPKTGDVDFLKSLNKALNKKEPIKIGGKMASKSTVDIAARTLRALVIEKNLGAIKFVVELQLMGEARLDKGGVAAPALNAEQQAYIDQLLDAAGYDPSPVTRKQPGEPDTSG